MAKSKDIPEKKEKKEKRARKTKTKDKDSKPVQNKAIKIPTIKPKSINQATYIDAIKKQHVIFGIGPAGTGKSLRNCEIVYTPTGPVKNGNLKVGDYVCTPDGKSAEILAVYPQGKIDIYRVTFFDGSTVDCSADHLWVVEDRERRRKRYEGISPLRQVNTEFLKEKINKYSRGSGRFSIYTSNAAEFQYIPYDIDPYVLGVLIGDGSISTASLSVSTADKEVLENMSSCLGDSYNIKHRSKYDYGISYNKNKFNPLTDALRKYNLLGKVSNNKSIPSDYLLNKKEIRLSVLQGLMDTDGTVDRKTGMASFCTVSQKLSEDVKFLVESLGGICNITEKKPTYSYKGQKKLGQLVYMCWIRYNNTKDLFRLSRKKKLAKSRTKKTKRIIRKIKKIGQDECTCIYVDSPDHMYLTNHFIPTHNTFLACFCAAEMLSKGLVRRIVLVRPAVETGEKLGFLPGRLEDKLDPYMRPLYDALNDMIGFDRTKELVKNREIEIVPLAYMRGRTLNNAAVILDEAQNTDKLQMKMFLTRMGTNSIFIVNGDTSQTDIEAKSGLVDVQDRLNNVEGIEFVYFSAKDIVRHAVVQRIVEAYEAT